MLSRVTSNKTISLKTNRYLKIQKQIQVVMMLRYIKMVQNTRELGRMVIGLVRAPFIMRTVISMRAHGTMERQKVSELSLGLTDRNMKASG